MTTALQLGAGWNVSHVSGLPQPRRVVDAWTALSRCLHEVSKRGRRRRRRAVCMQLNHHQDGLAAQVVRLLVEVFLLERFFSRFIPSSPHRPTSIDQRSRRSTAPARGNDRGSLSMRGCYNSFATYRQQSLTFIQFNLQTKRPRWRFDDEARRRRRSERSEPSHVLRR